MVNTHWWLCLGGLLAARSVGVVLCVDSDDDGDDDDDDDDGDDVEFHVLGGLLTYFGQTVTNA